MARSSLGRCSSRQVYDLGLPVGSASPVRRCISLPPPPPPKSHPRPKPSPNTPPFQMFHMEQRDAAKALNLKPTVFKALQKQLNVPRWPYRLLSSLDTLSNTIRQEWPDEEVRGHLLTSALPFTPLSPIPPPNSPLQPHPCLYPPPNSALLLDRQPPASGRLPPLQEKPLLLARIAEARAEVVDSRISKLPKELARLRQKCFKDRFSKRAAASSSADKHTKRA
jgi:hypothetical protein